ncbi:hypothetical protein IAT40_006469 [Kwoniella sp. CBS 6097]
MSTEGITLNYDENGNVVSANYHAYTPSAAAGYALSFCGVMETFGYYGRAWAHREPQGFGAWALQAFLIICAPPLISATVLHVPRSSHSSVGRTRNSRNPTPTSGAQWVPKWKYRIYTLYFASGCILLRNFVRVIEYAQGGQGNITTHEVYVYVFDAALMWASMTVFVVVHPGKLLKAVNNASTVSKDVEEHLAMRNLETTRAD